MNRNDTDFWNPMSGDLEGDEEITDFEEDAANDPPQFFSHRVTGEEADSRLDLLLPKALPGWTRNRVQKLIEDRLVQVNSTVRAKNYKLRAGDLLLCTLPPLQESTQLIPQDILLDVIYEDSALLVVNKPKGMVVHPAPGHPDHTLVNALLFHCGSSLSGIGGVRRPGIVHRIDKDTSGLLMVAKTDHAHQGLAAQIKDHSFLREYLCVIYGALPQEKMTISAPIDRSKTDRKRMAVVSEGTGRPAVTHCIMLQRLGKFSLVRCRLETGRTHQIRVHLASIGHPLAGDPVYGPKKTVPGLTGQCLHAAKLGFHHPTTGEWMCFEAPPPAEFEQFVEKLRRQL